MHSTVVLICTLCHNTKILSLCFISILKPTCLITVYFERVYLCNALGQWRAIITKDVYFCWGRIPTPKFLAPDGLTLVRRKGCQSPGRRQTWKTNKHASNQYWFPIRKKRKYFTNLWSSMSIANMTIKQSPTDKQAKWPRFHQAAYATLKQLSTYHISECINTKINFNVHVSKINFFISNCKHLK